MPRMFHILTVAWVGVAQHLDDRCRDHDLTMMVFVKVTSSPPQEGTPPSLFK
jgi:hypothetical protein